MREHTALFVAPGSRMLTHVVQLLNQLTQITRWQRRRNFLDISHLNGAPLPGGQYLLDTLPKNTVPLRDSAAAPSEKKVKLHGLALDIGTIVFRKDRDLGWEADAVPANLPPQFAQ